MVDQGQWALDDGWAMDGRINDAQADDEDDNDDNNGNADYAITFKLNDDGALLLMMRTIMVMMITTAGADYTV